jgi:phosphoketolase
MWLVVHMTYATAAPLTGRALDLGEYRGKPEGHTGGSLNMVPAYAGYLAANVLSGRTRSWVMGQGHCVAAIEAVNLIAGNLTEEQSARYDLSQEGVNRFVRDFYHFKLRPDGKPESPLGSHVNAHTAGGMVEGGYLGFTELQYVHMPLPGETLVTFLSDGAWEEQRGSDWAPRWWRANDCGIPLPIMIYNGRRIDQRSTLEMEGGPSVLEQHLRLHSFDPFQFNGRDPAAFVCAIFRMEQHFSHQPERYPFRLPYGIAVAPKGAGFYGEGTNEAHNLPLGRNPSEDNDAREAFRTGAARLWLDPSKFDSVRSAFGNHQRSDRVRERDHTLAHRHVIACVPSLPYTEVSDQESTSAMAAIDQAFLAFCAANPDLRPRVGNPDEMDSNRMESTLACLKFRAVNPEPGRPEDLHGAVITALNEEAVAAAATGNKGGINLIVTYEAFAIKMHGILRQEITFSNGLTRAKRPPGWLSVPVILTSQTWENSKNEYSHQDPAMAESMLGEHAPVSRVVFPADTNTALATIEACFETHGQIWTAVVAKGQLPCRFGRDQARQLVDQGVLALDWLGFNAAEPELLLTAMGAYQLHEAIKASIRLKDLQVPHRVVYLFEPGRLRIPRSRREFAHALKDAIVEQLFPQAARARVFITHTRPEPILGILSRLHTGRYTAGLGFRNDGGTLDVDGMLWVNGCSWLHCLQAAAATLERPPAAFLNERELRALNGELAPADVL